ncbi:hypothetical protein BRD19_10800 [Halobacteriales archaeon SW_7_65_23]|nr:MAG: hypothetical protein BRD19_10800 [Halobacteriales archaeon SW_7_65_23]
MERGVRVLHVDSDEEARERAAAALESVDDRFEIVSERTLADALDRVADDPPDCVVSEVELPDGNGLDLLDRLTQQRCSVPFVLFTAAGSEAVASEAFDRGATDYLRKGAGAYTALARRLKRELVGSRTDTEHLYQSLIDRERKRFSELFENFPEPTIAYGFDGDDEAVFRFVNNAFEETFGYDGERVVGERVNDTIVPEEHRDESENIDRRIDDGELVDREVQRLAAEERRIFNLRTIAVSVADEIDGFAVYTDITERKKREQELQRYETIVETMPLGLIVVDEQGTIINANEQAADIIGYDADDLVDEPFLLLVEKGVVNESLIMEYKQVLRELLSSKYDKDVDVIETEITRSDGETRFIQAYTSLLPYEESFRGSVQVYHDVTERRQNERERRRQNERLAEFASIVSHDLRNPLNVAKGHLDLLERECDSEHADTVGEALERMEVLIGETLELARQGEMVTETEPLALSELVAGCWGMVATGEATLGRSGNATINGDPERVKQLFENLFRNAVEHGSTSPDSQARQDAVEHGGSDVTITVGDLEDGFYVEDDGPGIPDDEREEVFDAGYTTSEDGTGFGLPIVKEIVEAHDWSIAVTESEAGGARFEITGVDVSE